MYADYFGLKEASFSITPDPHYLYLSQRHREALAHLLYGAEGNGGFVQLTGEVGTGKTTICRAFMEQIPQQVDLALILNPALTVVELLQAICQEFHIQLPINETSRMVLVDKLNHYLLAAHANGRRPVLMIDEAQNLSADVLEQLRLLTNLETSKHKLLQIFLIGQPELQEMLQRQELRQLAQRITARYHLTPLNETETGDYIRHRLAVAGVERLLFTRSALRQVHKLSGGIPRLINLLCDRALLGAFATHQHVVDTGIVSQAATELQGNQPMSNHSWRWLWWILLPPMLLAGLAWATLYWPQGPVAGKADVAAPITKTDIPGQTQSAEVDEPVAPPTTAALPEPVIPEAVLPAPVIPGSEIPEPVSPPPVIKPSSTIKIEPLTMDQHTAFNQLLGLWHRQPLLLTDTDPCQAVIAQGLHCHRARGTWNNIRQYQRPALLSLEFPSGTAYLLIIGLEQQTVVLWMDGEEQQLPLAQLEPFWFGDFILLWQPPPTGDTLISSNSPPDSVHWLKQQFREAGYTDENQSLAEKIRAFQLTENLDADGIAGPNTLIYLNARAGDPALPRLRLEPNEQWSIPGAD